jgi:hypothetical protein
MPFDDPDAVALDAKPPGVAGVDGIRDAVG